MATLVLQVAGTAIGALFGPIGAAIGQAAGALAGNMVDRALFSSGRSVQGARLSSARIPGADEGEAITRVYGHARIGGTLIWATRFTEHVSRERTGGKGGGGGSTTVTTYSYSANFAVGLCEGEIAMVRRIWADGQLLNPSNLNMRVYLGAEDQMPDPLILAKQGAGNAPAYRGLAYVVFENFPLENYGNRIPLLQFEVVKVTGSLERQIRAVTMIPGSSEHAYATTPVTEEVGFGEVRVINRNLSGAYTDWQASLDELQAVCPYLETVALVVSWFGTDMRAGHCRVLPGVEVRSRSKESAPWQVAGYHRSDAYMVSTRNGGPAYGGTPSDASVRQAIADLKKRGLKVCLYPFLLMDVPNDNGLPDPYGEEHQDSYGWRGHITCYPAPGEEGASDRTSAVRLEVSQFLTRTEGYRRMVLHYANLASQAGGVDLFLVGSELRGLTQLRAEDDSFPFVDGLVTLAQDVRAILGPATRLTYGADWSEYFGYQPQDGSGDVYFNLDKLWASSAIDAVGIDNYFPISDWRDSDLRETNPDAFLNADDREGMRRAIISGEGFDWFYASDEDRRDRRRSPIEDGLAGKDWVFRPKDIEGWWTNEHYERRGGVELSEPTDWVPSSKPIIFTELGCAAVDKGASRPSAFIDPKSSVSALPPFSSGMRSDTQQRRFLEAHFAHWSDNGLIDPSDIFCWTWDARPYPAFPDKLNIWSDGENWKTGHWLNGRLGASDLSQTVAAILQDHGFSHFDVSGLVGDLPGYVQGEVSSARQLLEPLLRAYQIDVVEDCGTLRFLPRGNYAAKVVTLDVLAEEEDRPLWKETRGHDSDFSSEVILSCFDHGNAYEQVSFRSRQIDNGNRRGTRLDLLAVLSQETALGLAENMLRDERLSRRNVSLSLPPSQIAIMPGDCMEFDDGPQGRFQVVKVDDGALRTLEAREYLSPLMTRRASSGGPNRGEDDGSSAFHPVIVMMDLPRADGVASEDSVRVAAFAKPWKRIVASSSHGSDGYAVRALIERPAKIGRLTAPLFPTVTGRLDYSSVIEARFAFGDLSSVTKQSFFSGANRLAVKAQNGQFEIIGFRSAEEVEPGLWHLSELLRGLYGTEPEMMAGVITDAVVVLLDSTVTSLNLVPSERGVALNWVFEGVDVADWKSEPITFIGGLRAQEPLAPVHLKVRRFGSDLIVTWVRRSRDQGDDFDALDVALDEPFERYQVTISRGELTLRIIEVDQPAFGYDNLMQSEDLIEHGQTLRFTIRQMGRITTLGQPASIDFTC